MGSSDTTLAVLGALGGSGAAAWVFRWLAKREGVRAAVHGREDVELANYREELRQDLAATRAELQKARKEAEALRLQRIKEQEEWSRERLLLEARLAKLEREKGDCQERIALMRSRMDELTDEVRALRNIVQRGAGG